LQLARFKLNIQSWKGCWQIVGNWY